MKRGIDRGGCCQTNEPKHQYSIDCYFYEITKERHSLRAASRFSLNVLRFESDLCELNKLWNEAWIEANFCRLCTRLSRCIVCCFGLHNLCIELNTTLNCFLKIGVWNERETYLHGHAPPHRSLYLPSSNIPRNERQHCHLVNLNVWSGHSVQLQKIKQARFKWVRKWVALRPMHNILTSLG